MAIAERFGGLCRVGLHEAGITVRQVQGKEVDFALDPADHCKRFAKIHLCVARCMFQRHKDLSGPAFAGTDIVHDNRDAAFKTMHVAKPLEYPFCCVALFAVQHNPR